MAARSERQAGNELGDGVPASTAKVQGDSTAAAKPDLLSGRTAVAADAFAGRVLSHYRLEERLGGGGMGVVYRATDLKLGRAVAIKLLARHLVSDESAKARFVREARAASAMDHPNIATVHEIGEEHGELFIAMALYEGETLKRRLENGRLAVDETLGILRQVLLGLEAAHGAGIVHRDIKPANILVTGKGTVKILDFGLAKLVSDSQTLTMTETGQAMGTMLYMSPEQLRGQAVDSRSDLWSLGVVAYEMLAGVSPFQTESAASTAMRILNEAPPALAATPGVPDWLAELVSQLLRKNPSERPHAATEVLRRLHDANRHSRAAGLTEGGVAFRARAIGRRIVAALIAALLIAGALGIYQYAHRKSVSSGGAINSLIVLPFTNAGGNTDLDYLAEGITEGLINSFSQLPRLHVIARTTAFRYKDKEPDFKTLRRDLSVDAVLTGRVRQVSDALVIQADLVSVESGAQLWGARYRRSATDMLSMQEEITRAIAEKLRPQLAPQAQQRVTKRYTDNPEAYQLYLRGRFFWNKRTKESLTKGLEYFTKAVEIDPNYALALIGMADSYLLLAFFDLAPQNEAVAQADTLVTKALAINSELSEAHATLANVRAFEWKFGEVEEEYKRAIELNNSYLTAHVWYGNYLSQLGRRGEALAEFKQALYLDPAAPNIGHSLVATLCSMGQYEQAAEAFKDIQEMSGIPQHAAMAICHLKRSMYREAIDALRAIAAVPSDPRRVGLLGYAYALSGRNDDAWNVLKELETRDATTDVAFDIATVYSGLGDKDNAFKWLEKAFERRSHWLWFLKISPMASSLESDPRFASLVRRIGLWQ